MSCEFSCRRHSHQAVRFSGGGGGACVTPIAFRDPPLLNVAGVHEPWALRSVIEVQTSDGRVGLGESYGDRQTLANLTKMAAQLAGLDPFDLNGLTRVVYAAVGGNPDVGAPYPPAGDKPRATALGAFKANGTYFVSHA